MNGRAGIGRRIILGAMGAGLLAPALVEAATPMDALYEAAKREGKMAYWGPEEIPLIRALIARFNATYPGIQVTHFRIEPAPAIQRMVAEGQAGQVNVDAFDSPLTYMQLVLDRNMAEQVDWAPYGVEPDYIFYNGRAISCWDLEIPLCINTDLVQPGEIKSYDDLLQPKWRGKVLLEARGLPLAILMRTWGEQRTLDYIAQLKKNDPVILVGGSPSAEALSSGRVAVVIGTYSSKIDLMAKQGAPVGWLTVSPIPSIVYVMCVAKGCKSPNAAKLWAAWIASAEGAKAVLDTTNFGLVHGGHLSPNGQKMHAAGAEIVLEETDPTLNQHRLTEVAAAIGALK
jgi:iron(III) transport system substrate-binding protein